jgi:hypothetical protein
MSHRRLAAMLVAGAVALIAGAWAAAARLDQPGTQAKAAAANRPVVAAATLPTPHPSSVPPNRIDSDPATTSVDASARRYSRQHSPHAAAAPFVQQFAAQPGIRPLPTRRSPAARVRVPANIDGCDRNYGAKTQCIPMNFPPDTNDKCDWLVAHGFEHVVVEGTDRQRLDHDHDRIACNDR